MVMARLRLFKAGLRLGASTDKKYEEQMQAKLFYSRLGCNKLALGNSAFHMIIRITVIMIIIVMIIVIVIINITMAFLLYHYYYTVSTSSLLSPRIITLIIIIAATISGTICYCNSDNSIITITFLLFILSLYYYCCY